MVTTGHVQCSGSFLILQKAVSSLVQEYLDTISMSTGSCNVKASVTTVPVLLVQINREVKVLCQPQSLQKLFCVAIVTTFFQGTILPVQLK